MYATRPYPHPRFLMIPELRNAERFRFNSVIDHPFFKHGPLLQFTSSRNRVVIVNRQLFYMMMTGRLDHDK